MTRRCAARRGDLRAAAQAPGACQRTQMGVYAGNDVVQRVKEMQARFCEGASVVVVSVVLTRLPCSRRSRTSRWS